MLRNPREFVWVRRDEKTSTRTLIEILILAGLLWLFLIAAGKSLRKIALSQIADLTKTKIEVGSVDFKIDGSVLMEDFVSRPHYQHVYDNSILKAKTVYARFGIVSLLLLRPRLTTIRMDDFVFSLQQDVDTGVWNTSVLKIPAPGGRTGKMPAVRLKNGMFEYSKVTGGQIKTIAAIPVDATFGFDKEKEMGYSFSISTAKWARFGKSRLDGYWKPGMITIAGGISSADIPAFERVWLINVTAAELLYSYNNDFSLKLTVKDLQSKQRQAAAEELDQMGEAFLKKFGPFTALQKFFHQFRPWGTVDIDLAAQGNFERLTEMRLEGTVTCKDISVSNRKFPYTVEHLVGDVNFTENSVTLNDLKGRHGDVELVISGHGNGLAQDMRYEFELASDNMFLDSDLYSALNNKQKEFWLTFSPSGVVSIRQRISKEPGSEKKNHLTVDLLDVAAVCRHFPYPLKNLRGRMTFEPRQIKIPELISEMSDQVITIEGEVLAIDTNRPEYYVMVDANNITLDSNLTDALSEQQRNFLSQFEMSGLTDARIKIFPAKEQAGQISFLADVDFRGASLRITGSSVVISDIRGGAVVSPEIVEFKDFRGRYGVGEVSLTGQVWPGQTQEDLRYNLLLHAEQVELSDDLFSLLPEPLKNIVSQLQPEGRINYDINFDKTQAADGLAYKTSIDCLGGSINFARFPYPLKDIKGNLVISKDKIVLENITASAAEDIDIEANNSTIRVNGEISLHENDFEQGLFVVSADDVFFDDRLGKALPADIRKVYSELAPTGRFDLDLKKVKVTNADDGEKYVDFAGTVTFKGHGFETKAEITELDGVLDTKGVYKTGDGFQEGQANFTARRVKIKGKELTNVGAQIEYDKNLEHWLTRDLVADCYGGRVAGQVELKYPDDEKLEYTAQIGFDRVDLKSFLSDVKQITANGNSQTSGKMYGMLGVAGQIGGVWSVGRCRIQGTDMRVGKLSPMAKLLQLKLTGSEIYAFDKIQIDAYINRGKLLFEQIDLSGEDTAFTGDGWLDLKSKNINLKLRARGHRRLADEEPSLWQSLTEGLGTAVVEMDVKGNFYEPEVKTTPLPLIRGALEILGTKQ